MGDRHRNLAQFPAALNPFQGGSTDQSRGGEGGAAGRVPALSPSAAAAAAAAAAAMAGGNPALWGELNRAMHYNNYQQQQHAAAAAAAYNTSGGPASSNWVQQRPLQKGDGGYYGGGNYETSEGGSAGGLVSGGTGRRVPSKGETKATPPLPPSLSSHQLGGDVYRSIIAHQYDHYMAALGVGLPPHSPSPTHRHNPLPPTHSPVPPSSISPISSSRFSPQQQQAAVILAAAAAAAASSPAVSAPSGAPVVNGGENPPIPVPRSPHLPLPPARTCPPSPSPPQMSNTESAEAAERARRRRKQDQPRRQTVIYNSGAPVSPPLPSDDSGGSYCSPPPSSQSSSHTHDMPISQAMSHALAHPFLAEYLNAPPPTSPPVSAESPLPHAAGAAPSPQTRHQDGNPDAVERQHQLNGAMSRSSTPSRLGAAVSPLASSPKDAQIGPSSNNNSHLHNSHGGLHSRGSPQVHNSHNSTHSQGSRDSPHVPRDDAPIESVRHGSGAGVPSLNSPRMLDVGPASRESPHLQNSYNGPHSMPSQNSSPHMITSQSSPSVQSFHDSPLVQTSRCSPQVQASRCSPPVHTSQSSQNSPQIQSSHNSPHMQSSHNSPHMQNSHNSPHMQSSHNSPHMQSSHNSPHMQSSRNSPLMQNSRSSPHVQSSRNSPHKHLNSSPHLNNSSRPSYETDSLNKSCHDGIASGTCFETMTESSLAEGDSLSQIASPRPPSESSRHSDQSLASDPSRNSDLARMELSRLHSPLPPSPGGTSLPAARSSYNGPLPQATATAREVPEHVGSGPSSDYDLGEDNLHPLSHHVSNFKSSFYSSTYYGDGIAPNDCSNTRNGMAPYGMTLTPAQKKSLSPLKTINLAALDSSDPLEAEESDAPAPASPASNVHHALPAKPVREPYSVEESNTEKLEKNSGPVPEKSQTSLSRSVDFLNSKPHGSPLGTPSNNTEDLGLPTKAQVRSCEVIQDSLTSTNNNNVKSFDTLEQEGKQSAAQCDERQNSSSNRIDGKDRFINGVKLCKDGSSAIGSDGKSVKDIEESAVNGDHSLLAPKKGRKRKLESESLSQQSFLSNADSDIGSPEGVDTKRRTRQRRAVSYVEDGTDPVLEMNEDQALSPAPSFSPTRKRGRKSKERKPNDGELGDGLMDALSPDSSTVTESLSTKDALSPEGESDRETSSAPVTPLMSPVGRLKGVRGRGRGRGRPPTKSVGMVSPQMNREKGDDDVSGPWDARVPPPSSSEIGKDSCSDDIYDFQDSDASGMRKSRGVKRGRKRGGGSKNSESGDSSGKEMISPPFEKEYDTDVSEKTEAIIETRASLNKTCVSERCEPSKDANENEAPEKPRPNFPFLTVKDPSVLMEKYDGKDDTSNEGSPPFQAMTDLSQCLISSQFDGKDGDSSGDGFSPGDKCEDLDLKSPSELSAPKDRDEEVPSIAYIPRMGRNREAAMMQAASRGASEKSAIEKVLLSLNENIASLDPPTSIMTTNTSSSLSNSVHNDSLGAIASSGPNPFSLAGSSNCTLPIPSSVVSTLPASTAAVSIIPTRSLMSTNPEKLLPSVASKSCSITITPAKPSVAPANPNTTVISIAMAASNACAAKATPVPTDEPSSEGSPAVVAGGSEKLDPASSDKTRPCSGRVRSARKRGSCSPSSQPSKKACLSEENPNADDGVPNAPKPVLSESESSINKLPEMSVAVESCTANQNSPPKNVYVMSIAEAVMSGSPRSSSRRLSSKVNSPSSTPTKSTSICEKTSPSNEVKATSPKQESSVPCTTSSRSRRSSRRSSHKSDPEVVVHVEVHPEPQSSSSSLDSLSHSDKSQDCVLNSSNSSPSSSSTLPRLPCASRLRGQNDLDHITVVSERECSGLRSFRHSEEEKVSTRTAASRGGASKEMPSNSSRSARSSRQERPKTTKDSSSAVTSKESNETADDTESKDKLNIATSPKLEGGSPSDATDEIKEDLAAVRSVDTSSTVTSVSTVFSKGATFTASCSSNLQTLSDRGNGSSANDTDSETIENVARFLKSAAESSSPAGTEGSIEEIPAGNEVVPKVSADEAVAGASGESSTKTSSDSQLSYRDSRPRRAAKPPRSEEQINEVLMLLNMDDEESEDEDYIPKESPDSDDNASNDASDLENDDTDNSSSDNDVTDDEDRKGNDGNDSQVSRAAVIRKRVSGKSSSKTRSRGSKTRKGKSRIADHADSKAKKVVECRRIEEQLHSQKNSFPSPYILLGDEPSDEQIVNEPETLERAPLTERASGIHFFMQGEVKSRNCRVGFNSTLHNNYDAFSKDLTWFCALCKQFSHSCFLGDLFGPVYIPDIVLNKKNFPPILDGQVQLKSASDAVEGLGASPVPGRSKFKRTPRHEASVPSTDLKKSRMGRSTPDRSLDSGTAPTIPPEGVVVGPGPQVNVPPSHGGPGPSDVLGTECWIHEACLVWLPGVQVVNSRLCGLEEAVTEAQRWDCTQCGESGASVGCLKNGCRAIVHYPCALRAKWSLDHQIFHSYCPKHKPCAVFPSTVPDGTLASQESIPVSTNPAKMNSCAKVSCDAKKPAGAKSSEIPKVASKGATKSTVLSAAVLR